MKINGIRQLTKCSFSVNRYEDGTIDKINFCNFFPELNKGETIQIENGNPIDVFAIKVPYDNSFRSYYYVFVVKDIMVLHLNKPKTFYFNVTYGKMHLKCYLSDDGNIIEK